MNLTKKAMAFWQEFPDPDNYDNWEVFKQNRFITAKIPILDELFLGRIVTVLKKV